MIWPVLFWVIGAAVADAIGPFMPEWVDVDGAA